MGDVEAAAAAVAETPGTGAGKQYRLEQISPAPRCASSWGIAWGRRRISRTGSEFADGDGADVASGAIHCAAAAGLPGLTPAI